MKKLIVLLLFCLVPSVSFAGTRTGKEMITTAVDLTPSGTFVDVGAEVNTNDLEEGAFLVTVGTGNASEVKAKILVKHTASGTQEYPLPLDLATNLTVSDVDVYFEYVVTAARTEYKYVPVELDGTAPFIQLQMASDFPSGNNATVSSVIFTERR